MDMEKVIKGLDEVWEYMSKNVKDIASRKARMMDKVADACNLLKEQDDLGTELTNAVELIHKKNERIEKLLKEQEAQKFFVDESGKITPLPVVVRCKDCTHWDTYNVECMKRHHPVPPYDCWFCAEGKGR